MRNISVFVLVRDIGGLCNLEIYLKLPLSTDALL